MRKKTAYGFIIMLLLMFLSFTGCQAGETTSEKEEETVEQESTDAEQEEIEAATEAVTEFKLEGTSPVFDRSLTEGKMAVYYMPSSAIYRYCGSTIGNGDSTLVVAPDGTTMLIDTQGPANTPAVVAVLQALGIDTIDYMVFSHEHEDHIGGYATLFRYINVKQVYMNDYNYETSYLHMGLMQELEEKNIPVTYLYEGDTFSFGGIDVKVYNPPKGYTHAGNGKSINNGSLAFRLTYGDSSYLLMGDLEIEQETRLIETYGSELQSDIAKMNHHGVDTETNTKEWISTVSAKLAILESAQIYHEMTLGRYALSGSTVLATCLNDTIAVWTSGDGTYEVQVQTESYSDYANLPDTIKNGYFEIK